MHASQTLDWKNKVALPCAHHWMAQPDVQPLPGYACTCRTTIPVRVESENVLSGLATALQCQSINPGRGMRRGGRGHSPPSPGCIVSLASTPPSVSGIALSLSSLWLWPRLVRVCRSVGRRSAAASELASRERPSVESRPRDRSFGIGSCILWHCLVYICPPAALSQHHPRPGLARTASNRSFFAHGRMDMPRDRSPPLAAAACVE